MYALVYYIFFMLAIAIILGLVLGRFIEWMTKKKRKNSNK